MLVLEGCGCSRQPSGRLRDVQRWQGAGLFASTYEKESKTMHAMGVWDRIGPGVCSWRQVYSADGGKTWSHDWVMHWRRIA